MRRRFSKKTKKQALNVAHVRANERIRVPRVAVIDAEGENRGEMDTRDALDIAKAAGLDLVEVSPKAKPPVCKVLDYGKFQYTRTKQARQAQAAQKRVETKGVRLGIRTDKHDLDFKKKQADKFLTKGNKVKVEIIMRGREKAYQDLARKHLQDFLDMIETPFKKEEEIKRFPGGFNTIIAPE